MSPQVAAIGWTPPGRFKNELCLLPCDSRLKPLLVDRIRCTHLISHGNHSISWTCDHQCIRYRWSSESPIEFHVRERVHYAKVANCSANVKNRRLQRFRPSPVCSRGMPMMMETHEVAPRGLAKKACRLCSANITESMTILYQIC